jgi:hypothetical protein
MVLAFFLPLKPRHVTGYIGLCPISPTMCSTNFAFYEIKHIQVFAPAFSNTEFIFTERSIETQCTYMEEEQFDGRNNGV